MKDDPKSSFVSVNDVQLHVLDFGGQGRPILLVHATGFLARLYKPIAHRLQSMGHIFGYDHRGHGDSSQVPLESCDWNHALADLESLCEKMNFSKILAIGHSMGGTLLGVLSHRRPDLIDRAVLIDPVIFELPIAEDLSGPNTMHYKALKRRFIFSSVASMYENYRSKPQFYGWRKDILHDYCEFGTLETSDHKRRLKCLPQTEAQFFTTGIHFYGLPEIVASQRPLLVILAEKERFHRLESRLRSQMKSGEVVSAKGKGHLMPMEEPEYVAELATRFFES